MPERPQPAEAVKVFFSYAHEDAKLCLRLQQHFSFLKRDKKIAQWFDGEIKPGEEWRDEIEEHLNSADVILLLISAAFANSDFCYNVETGRAMERHDDGLARVVPIILHPCDWKKASFAKLQALPGGDEAISEWKNTEKALYEVARGVREVVEDLIAERSAGSRPATAEERITPTAQVPPPPAIDFVPRKDREGRDIVERLQRELTQDPKRLIVLWGVGGVGKTTLAAETVRSLANVFGKRIVWASAEKRADFTYPTLLNEIATQLGEAELTKLATEPKEQAVRQLISAAPTLVVLDNFETVSPDEKQPCADFLATRAHCPALITTRWKVSHDAARHIHVESMSDEEAREFVKRWIGQEAHDPRAFEGLDYVEIIRAADARPYALQWVLAQIDLALEPRAVLEELARAEGEVGERVFTRSFELPQLGDDGRDTLLALSLFTPSASRPALAEVAGFGDDHNRLNEAVKRLAALRLVEATPGGQRLTIEGFTRSLAHSRLSADKRADGFRRRFVAYFLRFAEAHAQPTPEDYDLLEAEKDNLLSATEAAFAHEDWRSVMRMAKVLADPRGGMLSVRGYWDESVRLGKQARRAADFLSDEAEIVTLSINLARMHERRRGEFEEARRLFNETLEIAKRRDDPRNVAISFYGLGRLAQRRGDLEEARQFYDEGLKINQKIDKRGAAILLRELGKLAEKQKRFEEARQFYVKSLATNRRLRDEEGVAISLQELGRFAKEQGKLEEARRRFRESLILKRKIGDRYGQGISLHELGNVAYLQGKVKKARQRFFFMEARRHYNESLDIKRMIGDRRGIASTLHMLCRLAEDEGDNEEAARFCREALIIFEELHSPYAKDVLEDLTRVEGRIGAS